MLLAAGEQSKLTRCATMVVKSVPGAIATGSQFAQELKVAGNPDQVATAPCTYLSHPPQLCPIDLFRQRRPRR
jgi:predicted alpha/beta-hydrolase family hydrolase